MGFGGGDEPQQTQAATRNVPEWVEREGKELYGQAKGTTHIPETHRVFPGQRVAPQTGATARAFRETWQNSGYQNPEAENVGNMYKEQYKNTPGNVTTSANPTAITTKRFTDPNSQFAEYINKIYQPQAQRLNDESARAASAERWRSELAGQGNSSIGSRREDALRQQKEDQMRMLQSQVLRDASSIFQSDEARALEALKGQAGVHESDLNRALTAAQGNQTAELQNKGLNLKGAEGFMNSIASRYNMNSQDLQRMLGIGEAENHHTQKEIDANREHWNELSSADRMQLEWLSRMLGLNNGGELTSSQTHHAAQKSPWESAAGFTVPLISNFAK